MLARVGFLGLRILDRGGIAPVAFFLLLALALRAPQFGNPVIHVDEQFYLLVGDRMWDGSLPYVDHWDRKPIGLFLIYAAIRLLGGEGIVQYQIVATLFAAATAWLIFMLARRVAPPRGGLAAGAIYLVFLLVNGGDGGQAPVFYNLVVAGAAWAVVRAIERTRFDRAAFGFGCAAMALIGLALQIKYSVLLEGIYFGLALLAVGLRKGVPRMALLAAAAVWIALALLPTGLALAWYAAHGHADAFVFANFRSIFLRSAFGAGNVHLRLLKIVSRVLPMAVPAAIACAQWRRKPALAHDRRIVQRFYIGWVIAAPVSLLLFGTYHDHYALPLLLPFAVAGAPVFARLWAIRLGPGRRLRVPAVAIAVGAIGLAAAWAIVADLRWRRGDGSEVRAMAARVAMAPGERLFVFSGDPMLYHLSHSPLPTPWHFPTLLSESRDSQSLGVDPHRELARVMAARPQFVALRRGAPAPEEDPAAWAFVRAILAREYRLVLEQQVGPRQRQLYERLEQAPIRRGGS